LVGNTHFVDPHGNAQPPQSIIFTIIREEHIQQLQLRNTIRLSMESPLLVIEAVSPGESNRQRDYIDKRKQYQDRGIPEYWLIDI
jgi:Uma2 family endonuclease